MKKILLFFLLILNTTLLLSQSIPVGQYEIIFYITNINTDAQISGNCGSYVRTKLRFKDNTEKEFFYQPVGDGENLPRKWYDKFSASNPVVSIWTNAQPRKWDGNLIGGKCKNNQGYTGYVSVSYGYHTSYSNQLFCKNFGFNGYRSILPLLTIVDDNQTNNFLTEEENITLNSHSGFKIEEYNWEYSLDGDRYKPFPDKYNGKNSISFNAKDVLSREEINRYTGKKITIRQVAYNNKAISNTVLYTILRSAPHFVKVEPEKAKCAGENTGTARFFLDRALLDGEKLSVYVTERIPNRIDINVLDSDNAFRIDSLAQGTHILQISGFDKHSNQVLYSDGKAHKDTVIIDSYTPISYKLEETTSVSCYEGNDGTIKISASGGAGEYKVHYKKLVEEESDASTYIEEKFTSSSETTISGLTAGDYEFYVTDKNDCELRNTDGSIRTIEASITQPSEALAISQLTEKTEEPSANGRSDGYITVLIKGGWASPTDTYTVEWKDKQTDVILSSLENEVTTEGFESKLKDIPTGTYIIKVTDEKGCVLSKEIFIDEPQDLKVEITETSPVLCVDSKTASLFASAKYGIPFTSGDPYQYQWYKMNSTNDSVFISSEKEISGLGKGVYKVWAKDASNPPNLKYAQDTITEPKQLKASFKSYNVSCHGGSNGSIQITIQDGNPRYTVCYAKNGGGEVTVNLEPTEKTYTIANLTVGKYNFYVKDANGCIALFPENKTAEEITLTEPSTSLEIISRDIVKPSGSGRSDGSVIVKISGGVPQTSGDKYQVIWKNSIGTIIPHINSLDEKGVFTTSIKNLPKDNYTIKVTDANNTGTSEVCIIISIITVDEPQPLSVLLSATKQVDCNGNNTAEITAIARGGVTHVSGLPYTYTWYKIENGNDIVIENQTDSILNKVGIGIYKVKVEDSSTPFNMKESLPINITQPDPLATTVKTQNISCYDISDGKIEISVTGGVGNNKLYYAKKEVGDTLTYNELSPTGDTFYLNNLKAGVYSIYILDGNKCYAPINGKEVAELSLTQPASAVQISSQEIIPLTGIGRSDGIISLGITGGSPNSTDSLYHVIWKNETGQIITANDSINKDGVFITTISDLPKGVYTVEIHDENYKNENNGCYLTASINLQEPAPLTVSLENTQTIDCFGYKTGKLAAHAKGGIRFITGLPYKYEWYEVIGANDRLIPHKNDSILSNIGAGRYKVRIKDGSRIVNIIESNVLEITQPSEQKTEVKTGNISCFNGSDGFIHISVSGGTGEHRMFLKRNLTDSDYKEIPFNRSEQKFTVNNLLSGTYSVYIQDDNGCYAYINGQQIAIIELKQANNPLVIAEEKLVQSSGYNKNNGSIELIIRGGTPNLDGSYTVIWKDSIGNILKADNFIENNSFKSVLSGLSNGKFNVEITDANYNTGIGDDNNKGCILYEEYELKEPEKLEVYIEQSLFISCKGMSDGQLIAHAKGGISNPNTGLPYKYKWYKMNGDTYSLLPQVTDNIFGGVSPGDYKVEIEDYSRETNIASAVIEVIEPEKLEVTAENIHIECGQTANVSVNVTGGTQPYTYEWNTGDTLSYIPNAHPGKYMVFLRDARGCAEIATINVTSPSDLKVTGKVSDPICYGASNGNIILNVVGGKGPYTYSWSNGSTTKDLVGIPEGIYTVIVAEQGGCSFSESFELIDPEKLTLDLGEDALICMGQNHLLQPVVEDPKTTFAWTSDNGFESKESKVEISLAGTYKLTITDSKGCQASDEMTLRLTDYSISSEIVVATDVFVKDTVVFVNISHPEPDSIEWVVPNDIPARVVSKTSEMLQVIFDQTGEYSLGMRAHVKDCFQDVIKTIKVTNGEPGGEDNFGQTDVKEFVVYPNPSNGKFKVKVVLNKEVDIRLRMFSLNKGGLIDDRTEKGSKEYDLEYDKVIPAGTYILMLETPSGRKSNKIIIR